ncbi:MAG: hypothetical protein IIU97_06685, partial [Bacteroidaceae bacterium]|nr:hypothetical protein [Bacteroidaceae bacterium]
MHFLEFNIRYDISDGATLHMCYNLRDNTNTVPGTLALHEVQKGWWRCSMEVDECYKDVNYGYEL